MSRRLQKCYVLEREGRSCLMHFSRDYSSSSRRVRPTNPTRRKLNLGFPGSDRCDPCKDLYIYFGINRSIGFKVTSASSVQGMHPRLNIHGQPLCSQRVPHAPNLLLADSQLTATCCNVPKYFQQLIPRHTNLKAFDLIW
jgi:hypothetical protein